MNPSVTPAIELPLPTRQHPHASQIEAHTRAWAAQFGLVRSEACAKALARSRFGEFGAYTYPTAPLPEAQLVADWLAWLFLIDDQYEEGAYGTGSRWSDVTAAVRGVLEPGQTAGPLADAPLIRALADISHRLDRLVTPAWKTRFTRHFLATMNAALHEIQLRDAGTPPPLSDYIALRRDSGAIIPSFDLIEVCAHLELPEAAYGSSAYQEITVAGTDIVAWTNDLYSVDKEAACGIVTNLVLVLQHERHLDRQQALATARMLINDRIRDFLAAERLLTDATSRIRPDDTPREQIAQCAQGVRDWVAGSNQWHADGTDRYDQPPPSAPAPLIEDLLAPAIHTTEQR